MRGTIPAACWWGCRRTLGRLLWKIQNILSNVLRETKCSFLGEERGQNQQKKHKRSSKTPPLHRRREAVRPSASRIQFMRWSGSSSLFDLHQADPAGREQRRPVQTEQRFMYNKQVQEMKFRNLLRRLFQEEGSRNNTLPEKRRKGTILPSLLFPSRPLKALQFASRKHFSSHHP